jgi:hypothetical protein
MANTSLCCLGISVDKGGGCVKTPILRILGENFPQMPVTGELSENEISQSGLRTNVV